MSRTIHVVGAAIIRGDRCLAAQRSASMANPLKWEFPGGKLEPGEGPEQALAREIAEELGVAILVHDPLARGFGRTRKGDTVQLDVFAASLTDPDAPIRLAEHARFGWFTSDELEALDWDDADLPALAVVLRRLNADPR